MNISDGYSIGSWLVNTFCKSCCVKWTKMLHIYLCFGFKILWHFAIFKTEKKHPNFICSCIASVETSLLLQTCIMVDKSVIFTAIKTHIRLQCISPCFFHWICLPFSHAKHENMTNIFLVQTVHTEQTWSHFKVAFNKSPTKCTCPAYSGSSLCHICGVRNLRKVWDDLGADSWIQFS